MDFGRRPKLSPRHPASQVPRGEKIPHGGGRTVFPSFSHFLEAGRVCSRRAIGSTLRASGRRPGHARLRAYGVSAAGLPPVFRLFQRSFAVMVPLAKALQVAAVGKKRPVPAVRLDMVGHGRIYALSLPGTLTAKRLSAQLFRPQIIGPDLEAIPVMPLRRDLARGFGRLVLRTVSPGDQPCASWMPARPERFSCHWAITSKV